VLGLIIVRVVIGIAYQLFDTSAENFNKDSIAPEQLYPGMVAHQYFTGI
jgi:hypothetical protein